MWTRHSAGTPFFVQQFIISAVPIRVGEDRARRSNCVAKGAYERVRTVEQSPEPAFGGMHHDHVTGFNSKVFEIVAE